MMISFVVFLAIFCSILIINHAEDTFDCTGYDDDSYHPIYDAGNCRYYWHCIYVNTVYMHAVKRVCPAGTEFDATLRQCETASLVDCILPKSPHLPRTTSTTKAWKWKYSKLFSRKHWKPTNSYFLTTREHPIFDLGDTPEGDLTTMIMPQSEITEQIQVLPFTLPSLTTAFSLEQLSKNLHALVLQRRPSKYRPVVSVAKLFRIGEPESEAEIYTTIQRTRRTRSTAISTSIGTPTTTTTTTTFLLTTQVTTTTTIATTTTSIITSSISSTSLTIGMIQPEVTININPQPRINSQRRRNNMTLFILTSDEHKIRRFSVNHTRGILLNCNQLRRRLLGRRRLRDIFQTTTNHTSLIRQASNSSNSTFHCKTLSLIILSFVLFMKLIRTT